MITRTTGDVPLLSVKSASVNITDLDVVLSDTLNQLAFLWKAFYPKDADGLTITSGCEGTKGDGVHGKDSLHYVQNSPSGKGRAVDIRTRDVAPMDTLKFATAAGLLLGGRFDVVTEVDHIHIEYDPS